MSRQNSPNRLRLGFAATVAVCFASATCPAQASPTAVDLSTYVRVGSYDLPEPTRTTPPINSLLAQEASGITYNWDTDTLFVVGDGGTSVVQVSKTGQLIDSMTLGLGSSPQGTDFYDTEGVTYIGSGKFVFVEERYRQANLFTYVAGGTQVQSRLTIVADPGSPLTVPDMTMEGVTMDRDGFLHVANENGGGDANHPQLWVYGPSTAPNQAPTGVTLLNPVNAIPENTSVASAGKVADISIADDGLGNNGLSLSGPDASFFQTIGVALFLKAGTVLNATAKPSYSVTVNVDDTAVGASPDATVNFTLTITASTGGTPSIIISEVAPWSSGNSPVAADWFEVTNIGTAAAVISGWKMDDNSNSFGSSVALNGITSIAPGESVIFLESSSGTIAATFKTLWFGASPPANLQIGTYSGSGVGLSTGGDAVNLYNASGVLQANVVFGVSPSGPFPTFDNAAALNNTTISTLSAAGVNGAFVAANDSAEIGSPGTIGAAAAPLVTVVATDPNASEVGPDPGTFRITRTGSTISALTVNYTLAIGAGQASSSDYTPALSGVATIAAGQSFVDIVITPVLDSATEGAETVFLTLGDTGSYDVGSPANATITIADAPGSPVPALPPPAIALLLLGLVIPGWRSLSRRREVGA